MLCPSNVIPEAMSKEQPPPPTPPTWQSFRTQRHSLRLGASNVAALAGLHPFKDLPQLALDLIYQGRAGAALLQQDAAVLELTLVSDDQVLRDVATKAGPAAQAAVQRALQVKDGTQRVSTVQEALLVKQNVEKAVVAAKLSKRERQLLREATRSAVDTGFGTSHEDDALDQLGQITQTEVHSRNQAILAWHFATRGNDTVAPLGSAQPLLYPRQEQRRDGKGQGTTISISDESHRKEKASKSADRQSSQEMAKLDSVADKESELRGKENKNLPNAELCLSAEKTTIQLPPGGDDASKLHAVDSLENDQALDLERRQSTTASSVPAENVEKEITGAKQKVAEQIRPVVDPTEESDVDSGDEENVQSSQIHATTNFTKPPFFSILGSVDGIRDEIISLGNENDEDDNASWQMETLVVEVKHRMKRVHAIPPLYEQVQAVVYAFMYQVPATEIVQVLRTKKSEPANENKKPKLPPKDEVRPKNQTLDAFIKTNQESSIENAEATKALEGEHSLAITVNRVNVDDPVLKHRQSWSEIILPRLRSFVEAVYRIRGEDHKRYRFLMASSQLPGMASIEAWELLHEECPWLRHCDTAFRRLESNTNM